MPNSWIQTLNHASALTWRFGAQNAAEAAILALLALFADSLIRHRVRAALRYGLWMLVLLKLALPPGLISPTSVAYWLGPRLTATPAPGPGPRSEWKVSFSEAPTIAVSEGDATAGPTDPQWTPLAIVFVAWVVGAVFLALAMVTRHQAILRWTRQSTVAPDPLQRLLHLTARELGIRRPPQLRQIDAPLSPALCGFWRPVIVVPTHLELSDTDWRAIFLHELTHLQRWDLWANTLQTMVQWVWWWNPMVWWLNARIRHLRETAVDEAVMLASPHDAGDYPATLVRMARHCLAQPASTLGFLGILTSPSRLEIRVRRLLEMPLPKSARLGWSGWCILLGLTAILVPMGYRSQADTPRTTAPTTPHSTAPEALFTRQFKLDSQMLLSIMSQIVDEPIATGKDVDQLQLHRFLAHNGLKFPNSEPGKTPTPNQPAVFFNRTNGTLFARATLPTLDRLEKVIQNLSPALHQIQVEARFVEGDINAIAALNISGLTTNALAPGHALLTETEAAALLARFKAAPGFEILSTPKVTTLSGRGAEVSVVDTRTIVTGQSNTATGITVLITNSVPCGPTLQVTAWHDTARPGALKMSATARFVEFLGYQEAATPMPIIRSNSVSADARLWDGQTHLLQMSPITNLVHFVDRVPVLSDIPLVGRLFQTSGSQLHIRQRVVLITPTLIDPAGNRLYDAQHRPFDPATKP